MAPNFLNSIFTKRFLGVDIGTSFIKMVEISRSGSKKKLENYGEISSSLLYKKPFRTFEKNSLWLSNKDVAKAILAIMDEAKIKTRQAVFSIPDFSSFFTNFQLPPMTKEELPQAIRFEAKQHIPLPLSEVALDWQVIDGNISSKEKTKLKILLVAVPKEVIDQYQQIASLAQLKLYALEAEIFGLIRSLVLEEEKDLMALVDIGAQSTTCNVVEGKVLNTSYSFDMSGNELTKIISKGLDINYLEAEKLKKKYGILGSTGEKSSVADEMKEILIPLIDVILKETERILSVFYQKEGKEVKKVILTGGTALLPGLKEYFKESLKKEVEVRNPFSNLFYPQILEKGLGEMGPSYSIAVGMALRGLEY